MKKPQWKENKCVLQIKSRCKHERVPLTDAANCLTCNGAATASDNAASRTTFTAQHTCAEQSIRTDARRVLESSECVEREPCEREHIYWLRFAIWPARNLHRPCRVSVWLIRPSGRWLDSFVAVADSNPSENCVTRQSAATTRNSANIFSVIFTFFFSVLTSSILKRKKSTVRSYCFIFILLVSKWTFQVSITIFHLASLQY